MTSTPTGRFPDFLVIGGVKCGTTALHQYLSQHHAIHLPDIKETHFFDSDHAYGRGIEHYVRLLGSAGVPPAVRVGEASPGYLMSLAAPGRVAAIVPGVKLVVVLRDPVDRAYSHYWQLVRRQADARSFDRVVADHVEGRVESVALTTGLYADGLDRWLELFPRDRLLVLVQPLLDKDRAATLAGVARFLEIEDRPESFGDVAQRHHVSTDARLPALNRLIRSMPETPRRLLKLGLGPLGAMRLKRSLMVWNRKTAKRPPMSESSRALLERFYAPSNERLAKLLGRLPWDESTP